LLRDEGKSQLSYIDIANPDKNWYVPVPAGRIFNWLAMAGYLSAQVLVTKKEKLLPVKKWLS